MNAQRLQLPNGTAARAYQCSKCGSIQAFDHEAHAEFIKENVDGCCLCRGCGKEIDRLRINCDACEKVSSERHESERLSSATLVEDYDGPVLVGDDYYRDIEAVFEELDDDEIPEFAHCCEVFYYQLDADNIIANMLEDAGSEHHSEDDLVGVGDLRAAVEAFNKANSGERATEYWEADYKRKVRLRPAKDSASADERTDQ